MIMGFLLPDASQRPRNGWPPLPPTAIAAALVGEIFMTSDWTPPQ